MPHAADVSTPLAYALAYAAMGWHVLPLEPNAKAPLGKLVPRGMLDATVDADTIQAWWRARPAAGIGIALAPSGLVAIDVDPRNGGTETFDVLQSEHGSLVSDVMAYTGGGGEHHVFVVPPNVQISLPGTLGAGIDLKANGYIVVEPSVHPSGKQYGWEASSSPLDGVVPSPLPDWLRSLRVDLRQPELRPGAVPVDPQQARDVREALYVLDAEPYDSWLRAGMALHATGWGHAAYAMWCAWAQQSSKFDSTASRKKWESFRSADGGLTTAWIFSEAQQAGWANPRARLAAPTGRAEGLAGADARAGEENAPEGGYRSPDDPALAGALPLIYSEDVMPEHVNIPQLVEDTLTAQGLTVMYGEPNSGKSFLACDLACSVAAGVPWLGKRTVRGAVLYVAGEGAQSIKMRMLAWRQHHGLEPWLAIVPVAVNMLIGDADLTRLIAACAEVSEHYSAPVALIVIDTLARSFGGGNENASEDMGAVIANADRLRHKAPAHLLFVHHSGKDAAKGSRGHSSLHGATDTEIEVTAEAETKVHFATVAKQRDLPSRGAVLAAKFESVEMGRDQWGKPVTTCVVELSDAAKRPASYKRRGGCAEAAVSLLEDQTTTRTLARSELGRALEEQGFSRSSIYDALTQLHADGRISFVANGKVYLLGGVGRRKLPDGPS